MALQAGSLRAALIEAGASEQKADVAATEAAAGDTRLHTVEIDIAELKAETRALAATVNRMFAAMLACFGLTVSIMLAGFGWMLSRLAH